MSAGYFKRTYPVWRKTTTDGPYGEPVEEWNKIADAPGRAFPARMNDTFAAQQQAGIVTWTFATPADTDIQTSDQVRFDGRTLDVLAVSVTSRGDRIEALAEEQQAGS